MSEAERLLGELSRVEAADADEARWLERIRRHVEGGGDLFDRRRFDGHLTGSAFIVDAAGERVLLLFHPKLARHLQPGGHGEAGETHPFAVASREALEETGIEGLTLHPKAPGIFDVDVHVIPARGDEPAHEHLDIRYLFVAPAGAEPSPPEGETKQIGWVKIDEAGRDDESVARAMRKLARLLRQGG